MLRTLIERLLQFLRAPFALGGLVDEAGEDGNGAWSAVECSANEVVWKSGAACQGATVEVESVDIYSGGN